MTTVEWNNNLAVNIDVIDMQHQNLIKLINTFYQNISNGLKKEELQGLIKGLAEYTIMHFTTEEMYMKKFQYPDYEKHKAEHDKFVTTVQNFEERFVSGKILMSIEVTSFIKDWLVKHIMDTDKTCAEFLRQKGLK